MFTRSFAICPASRVLRLAFLDEIVKDRLERLAFGCVGDFFRDAHVSAVLSVLLGFQVRRAADRFYLRSYQAHPPRTMPKAAPDVAFSDTSARMWDKMRKKCRFFLQLLCVLH